MEKTRVLVTGATGFLGRNILHALSDRSDVELIAACRVPKKLPADFSGETRVGDLLDAKYRRELTRDVDVICHAGTWASFWGHAALEKSHFYEPAIDLIENAINSGVQRFLLASTVAIARKPRAHELVDDFAETAYTGYWPHLDRLIDVDRFMQTNASRGMKMINMRLGHFVGRGNRMGMVPALVPRMKTHMVPWLSGGRSHMPLVADSDLGEAFALASTAPNLNDYESFNICGAEFPTAREVFEFIASETCTPTPWFSVPYFAGYMFGWLMETLHPLLPEKSPFLTRSLVHVSEDWLCSTDYARTKLGYEPRKLWQTAVREALSELKAEGFPWPYMAQAR